VTGRRWILLVVAAVLLAAAVTVAIVLADDDDHATVPLTVGWGGSEGHPSCRYDATARTVTARLTIAGTASGREKLTVTVTAYADENTSQPLGSSTRSVSVEGTVHRPLVLTIRVSGRPHVDEDGETACRLAVKH